MSLISQTTCLEHVNLQHVVSVSDNTALQLIRTNKSLKTVNLQVRLFCAVLVDRSAESPARISFRQGCVNISDQVVRAIAQFSNSIVHLNLRGCSAVTDRALLVGWDSCHAPLSLQSQGISAGAVQEELQPPVGIA